MTSRREFLQIGIAAGAWPLASRAGFAVPGSPAGPMPLYKVVYDMRFPNSVAFGERARELGLATQEIDGDITAFWYHELDALWRAGSSAGAASRPAAVAIAGLTAHGPLFCLERLAWDRRMRVVFRVEHDAAAPGSMGHRLEGPVPMLASGIPRDGAAHWAPAMAEVVANCPQGRTEISSARVVTPDGSCVERETETLYTWVIAPAVRV